MCFRQGISAMKVKLVQMDKNSERGIKMIV